jgi:cell division protein FtsA
VTRARRLAALDLGTTKACCAIADVDSDGLRVLGFGQSPSRGVRKGAIVDIERAAEAVAEAVDATERMSGLPVDAVVVGIAGGHLTSQNSRGVVAVPAGHREVRHQDITRAVEAARAVSVPSDREIVHVLPQQFTIDGQDGVRDAIGMIGTRLEVDTHIITGSTTAIQNVIKVMHTAGLDVEDLVLQVLASARAVTTEDEIERGVAVVDVGGGTTDIAVFGAGSVLHTGVVPVGGNHVTGDLAVGLRSDLETAEMVKRAHGHCLQLTIPADATLTLTPMGYEEPVAVPQRYLAEVIGPRAREMAVLIDAEISRSGAAARLPGGVVMCGGGALLRGFAEIVQQVTDLPVRVAAPPVAHGMDEGVRGPEHATLVGMLLWGDKRGGSRTFARTNGHGGNGHTMNTRFGRWLRELF